MTVEAIVQQLNMQPHPEGGFYKETYRSALAVAGQQVVNTFGEERKASTAIYFLLTGDLFSAFHKIKSDEVWHFYTGDAVDIYVLNNHGLKIIKLGSDLAQGQVFQAVVKANDWFASKCTNCHGFSLVGCTVAPGFDFTDFELAKARDLTRDFPKYEAVIKSLCRQ